MVFLYKHGQQVKGLRGKRSEQRAAKAVVAPVTLHVVLCGVNNGLWVYTPTVRQTTRSPLISDLRIFFTLLCAALSPVIIIASNRKVNGRLKCAVQEKPFQEKATSVSAVGGQQRELITGRTAMRAGKMWTKFF